MNATELIEAYIDDTVRLLPRHQRADVAIELRSLLNDELNTRARDSGGQPDETLALSLVRDYGPPNEVAARYHSAWTIIAPADSRNFIRAAILGAGAIVLLSLLSRRSPPRVSGAADEVLTVGILAWLGFLVVAFGVKSWIRRQWPATAVWKPRDRDRVSRVGTAVLVPIASFVVVLYVRPLGCSNKSREAGLILRGQPILLIFSDLDCLWC